MTIPDLNDVALFVRVVRARSFSAAARERAVPVSTVSRRIARLEAALGIRVLERTTRALRLTEAGGAYFEHAARAIDDLGQGSAVVRELRAEPRGRVRVVAPITFGTSVSAVLARYLLAHPHVAVDLELRDRPGDMLAEGIDIAIRGGRVEGDSADFVARELWRPTRKLLLASPRYLARRGVPRDIDDLVHHDCIAMRTAEGTAGWTLCRGSKRRRVVFEPRFAVNDSASALRATLAGVGIALLPEVVCRRDIAAKRLVRVLDEHEGEAGGVAILYRAHRSLTAAVRTCIDHLVAELPATDPTRGTRSETAAGQAGRRPEPAPTKTRTSAPRR